MANEQGYFEEVPGLGIFFVSGSERKKIRDEIELYTVYNFRAPPPPRYDKLGREEPDPPGTSKIVTRQLTGLEVTRQPTGLEVTRQPPLTNISEYMKAIESAKAEAAAPRSILSFYQPEQQVGDAVSHRMSTGGELDTATGYVHATTTTRATAAFSGFHGAAILEFWNAEGRIIERTIEDHRFGVDGWMIGQNFRTDRWSENIDTGIASRVVYVTVLHTWAPWDWLRRIKQFLEQMKNARKMFEEFKAEFESAHASVSSLSALLGGGAPALRQVQPSSSGGRQTQ